jgi:rhomboid domain-containing protein 1
MRRGRPQFGHRGHNDIFVVMMFMQLIQQIQRLPYKPPVTLGLMFLMAALHFSPEAMHILFDGRGSMETAFNPYLIVQLGDWNRLWMSTLVHANAMHLYCKFIIKIRLV